MTQSTVKKIAHGVAWTSLSSFLVKVIGLVYTAVVLSQISVYDYGLVELAMSMLPILGVFSLAGLQPVMVADLVSHKMKSDFYKMRYQFSSFVSLKILLGIFAFLILNTLVFFFKDSFPTVAVTMVQVLSFVFFAGPIRASVVLLYTIYHRFDVLAHFKLIEELFKLLLVSMFLIYMDLGPLGVVLAFVITDFVVMLVYLPGALLLAPKYFNGMPWSIEGIANPMFAVRHHAKWSVFQSSLHQAGQNIRPWIIQFFLGTQAVGIYAVAMGLFQHSQSLAPVTKVLAPIVPEFKEEPKRLFRLLNNGLKYQILLLIIIVGGSTLFLPLLFSHFFPGYIAALPLFFLLAFALIPDSFAKVYEAAFHTFRLQKSLFLANIVRMVSILIVLPLCVLVFGLYGVALEVFITLSVYAYSRYRVLKRKLPDYSFSARDLYTVNGIDRMLFAKIMRLLTLRNRRS
tara:strand:- start:2901 stop:4271 length:1371 start_codon:yes stop_codon:yes gene_type:complete